MANVYYKIDSGYCYYTNEAKSGYSLRQPGNESGISSCFYTIELYNDKFILPADSSYLFDHGYNVSFNDTDKGDTSEVTNMYYMFNSCQSLTSLDLSNGDTSNVTDMSYVFYTNRSIKSINLSDWNTSKVTTMERMFHTCENLTSLDLSSFDTSNVTNMSCMFTDCSKLTELNLSSFNTEQVTDMFAIFMRCYLLKKIYVSELWTTSSVSESDGMFANCNRIVGQSGTTYNSDRTDRRGAVIDTNYNGTGGVNKGYLTYKQAPAKGVKFEPWIKENDIGTRCEVCL